MSELLTQLDINGIQYRTQGKNVGRNFVNICCPQCGEDRYHFGIHSTDYWYKCWVCGDGGGRYKLYKLMSAVFPSGDWSFIFKQSGVTTTWADTREEDLSYDLRQLTRPFHSYNPDHMHKADLDCWQYLVLNRRLNLETIQAARPGVGLKVPRRSDSRFAGSDLRQYVTFTEGQALTARKLDRYKNSAKPRWWRSPAADTVLYGESWVQSSEPEWLVITEGVFDTLSVPIGYGLGILGSVISQDWLGKFAELVPNSVEAICIALDEDVFLQHQDTITNLRLVLKGDFGYEVGLFPWSDKRLQQLDGDIKLDLDNVRLHLGADLVLSCILESVGIISYEEDKNPLL